MFVQGTSDSYYSESRFKEIAKLGYGRTLVIPGADHSLEIEGDAMESIRALTETMTAIREFLSL